MNRISFDIAFAYWRIAAQFTLQFFAGRLPISPKASWEPDISGHKTLIGNLMGSFGILEQFPTTRLRRTARILNAKYYWKQ